MEQLLAHGNTGMNLAVPKKLGNSWAAERLAASQAALSSMELVIVHQWFYSTLLGPDLFFSFVIFFYRDVRTPWTSDQPVTRPLPTHRILQTQIKRTQRHPCLQ
jgi:hypothetical protein